MTNCFQYPPKPWVAGVTTFKVGNVIYRWDGLTWEAITPPISDALDSVFRRETDVASVEAGYWDVGSKLTLVDRAGAKFDVVSGVTPNGFDIIDAGSGNTAVLVNKSGDILFYGHKDIAGFDATDYVQAAINHCGKANSHLLDNPVEIGVVTTTRKSIMNLGAVKLIDVGNNAVGFNLNHPNSKLIANIDGAGGYRSAVNLNADNCKFKGEVNNLTSTDSSSAWQSGVEINGGDNCSVKIKAKNHVRAATNDSIPRVITAQGSSTNWHLEEVLADDVNGGVANTTDGTFDFIRINGASDNGLYNLAGKVVGSKFIYNGNEEAIVHRGNIELGDFSFAGSGIPIGMDNGDALYIGSMVVSGSPTQLVRLRAGNVLSNKLEIGKISGGFSTQQLFGLFTGSLKKLIIGGIDAKIAYTLAGAPTYFGDLSGVTEEFHVKNWTLRVTDTTDALGGSNRLNFLFPASTTGLCSVKDVDVYVNTSDGLTVSPAEVRLFNLAKSNVYVSGARWQANVGPYAREATYNGGQKDSVSTNVVAGTWRIGTDLALTSATVAPFRTRCVASGTSGTWINY